MFGYVTINRDALPARQQARWKSHYCGLCHVLGRDWGQSGRMTLSYDMTFLAMLLNALYEPEESLQTQARCIARPWRKETIAYSAATEYAAEMNIAYAYFQARDDSADDHSARGRALAHMLKGRYARVRAKHPAICAQVEASIATLSALEREKTELIDLPVNAMGQLFGTVFAWREDFWHELLFRLGSAIGRFVYLCDAYEDREKDEKKGLYNPLSVYASRPDYEEFVHRILTMTIAEGAEAFELLPLGEDAEILRNVLYSGIWSRYGALRNPERKPSSGHSPCERALPRKDNALKKENQS